MPQWCTLMGGTIKEFETYSRISRGDGLCSERSNLRRGRREASWTCTISSRFFHSRDRMITMGQSSHRQERNHRVTLSGAWLRESLASCCMSSQKTTSAQIAVVTESSSFPSTCLSRLGSWCSHVRLLSSKVSPDSRLHKLMAPSVPRLRDRERERLG
jgi:hypothetical protein